MPKKTLFILSLLALIPTGFAAENVSCSGSIFQGQNCTTCSTTQLPTTGGATALKNLSFTWKNLGKFQEIIYKDEQSFPKVTPLNGAKATLTPEAADAFWKWSPTLSWVSSIGVEEFILNADQEVETYVSNSDAEISLDTTGIASNTPVLLVKSSIFAHDILSDTDEGPTREIAVCNAYVSGTGTASTPPTSAPAPTPTQTSTNTTTPTPASTPAPTPVVPSTPIPAPTATSTTTSGVLLPTPSTTISSKEVLVTEASQKPVEQHAITSRMTKVETWPKENIMILLSLLLGCGYIVLRKKSAQ